MSTSYSLASSVLFIIVGIVSTYFRISMRMGHSPFNDNQNTTLADRFYRDKVSMDVSTHPQGNFTGTDPNAPPQNLEDMYAQLKRFTVGPFRAGIDRKSACIDNENRGLATLRVVSIFRVDVPSTRGLEMRIGLKPENWKAALEAQTPAEFAKFIDWDIGDEELAQRLGHRDCIQLIRWIFAAGPGHILASGTRFSVFNTRGINSIPALRKFKNHSSKLFCIYAQIAQARLLEWRSGEVNFDWWDAADKM